MAIFHLSVKTVSRSAGRSATAAAAYRAGVEITDERTGEVHNYRRKSGIESAALFLPADAPEWASERAKLWNAAEQSETRKNSTVAREFEVALPAELSPDQRRELAHDFTRALVKKYGFAADCAIHLPGKAGDSNNHHAHILCTTRKLTVEGFAAKTRELDDRATGAGQVLVCRELFARMTNSALEKHGFSDRVDHRSLAAQGIDRAATIHLGPSATAIERRGEVSQKTEHHQERQREAAGKVAATVALAEAAAVQRAAAAQREATRQAQAALEAAQQAATARQARTEAQAAALAAQAREAREEAIDAAARARQAREAAAQAAHDLATADKATREKEDDTVRAAALSALGKSSQATHENLRAADGHLGRALQGIRKRQHHRHAKGIVRALAQGLGRLVGAISKAVEAHLAALRAPPARDERDEREERAQWVKAVTKLMKKEPSETGDDFYYGSVVGRTEKEWAQRINRDNFWVIHQSPHPPPMGCYVEVQVKGGHSQITQIKAPNEKSGNGRAD